MECDKIKILLSAYLDGELGADEQRQMEEHLERCASCRQDLEDLKGYLDLVEGIPAATAPEELKENTWQALRTRGTTPFIVRVTRNSRVQLISSLAAAAIVILYLAINPNFLNTAHVTSDLSYQVVKKGKGPGERKGVMSDESKEVKMLKGIARSSGGEVREEAYNHQTGMTDYITLRVPRRNYKDFLAALEDAGVKADLPEEMPAMVRYVSIQMYFPGRKMLIGDVNGDGRSDMAAYFKRGKNTGQWYVAFHLKEAEFATPEKMLVGDSAFLLHDFETPLFADLDGDGLSDLLVAGPDLPWQAFVNQGGRIFRKARISIPEKGLPAPDDLFVPLTGDFDGDGYDDLAVHFLKGENAEHWFISLNKRNMAFDEFCEYSLQDSVHEEGVRYLPFVLDLNGDGYDDAGKYWQEGDLIASWFIGINDQQGGFLQPQRVYFGNSPLAFMGDYLPFTGDVSGDGFDDLMVKMGTQDETGEWYLMYNEEGRKFTYGFDVVFGEERDVVVSSQ